MATKNFFIDATIDGRKTRVTGGPSSKDGGFSLKVYMRDKGAIEIPVRIDGWAWTDDDGTDMLTLTVETEGQKPVIIKKER